MIINLILAALCAAPALAAEPSKKVAEISTAVASNKSVATSTAAASNPGVAISTAAAAAAAVKQRLSARCSLDQFGAEALMSDAALRADLRTYPDESRDILEFAVCLSLQGTPGACSSLVGLHCASSKCLTNCRSVEEDSRLAFLTLRGGDALPSCRKSLALDGIRGPSVDKDCAALIGAVRAGGPRMSCESLASAKIAASPAECEDLQAFWSGSLAACDRQKGEGARRECRSHAALMAGLRDPAQCAASPFCQALVAKSPVACEPLRERFTRTLCARVAKDIDAEKKSLAQVQERGRAEEVKAKEKAAAAEAAAKEKVLKLAAVQAAKEAAVAAAVRAKVEANKEAEARTAAKKAKKNKLQFRKGEPMQTSPEVKEIMKALEEGRPMPKPKKQDENEEKPAEQ